MINEIKEYRGRIEYFGADPNKPLVGVKLQPFLDWYYGLIKKGSTE